MIDFIVTRKPDDPTHYRHIVQMCPDANLIEVPMAPSCTLARQALPTIGTSEYIAWFDPDDKLYSYTLPNLISVLKKNPGIVGVLCLSDYQQPGQPLKTIKIEDFARKPVDGHWFRILRRDWLAEHIALFDCPVNEWPVTAAAIEAGAIFVPIRGYCWIIGDGDHKRVSNVGVQQAREAVKRILGTKYAKLVEQYKK